MALPSGNAFEPEDQGDPTLSVDGLGDLLPKQGDRYDSTLSVSALDELFVPRLVAPIARVADEPRAIGAADDASEATGRGADVLRLAARTNPTPAINRHQEIFAPEFAAPIALADEPRAPTVKHLQDIFAPEFATPTRHVVDEPPLIVSNGRDSAGRDDDVYRGNGSATVVARVIENSAIGPRVQEMFAPELCAPIRRVVEEPHLVLEEPRLVVEEPRLLVSEVELVSDAGLEAAGRKGDVDSGADTPPLVASVMHDDAITDLGRVECEDPTLAVDSLDEFFAPEPVAPITRIVEELLPPGLESCLGGIVQSPKPVECGTEANAHSGRDGAVDPDERESTAEIRRTAMEFQRFAEMFHAFATDIQQR